MAIPVTCTCGKQYRFQDELAGGKVKCPQCGSIIEVANEIPYAQLVDTPPGKQRFTAATPGPERIEDFEVVKDDPAPPRIKRRPRRFYSKRKSGIVIHPGMVYGFIAMLFAVMWFVAGLLFMNRIYFYPPILFLFGLIRFLIGCFSSSSNDETSTY